MDTLIEPTPALHRVRIAGHFWSGYSITAQLGRLPAVGDTIYPWKHDERATPESRAEPYCVMAIVRSTICPTCGSTVHRALDAGLDEWVIHVVKLKDVPAVADYYARTFPS